MCSSCFIYRPEKAYGCAGASPVWPLAWGSVLAGAGFALASLAILSAGHGGGAARAQALANHNSNAPVDFNAGSIEVQGDRSDVASIIARLGAELSGSHTLNGVVYVIYTATANGIRVRITAVERAAVTA